MQARSGASRQDVERALYTERSLVRQLAMRRTVFAFPSDLLPAVRGSAPAARVAAQQAGLLGRSAVAGGLTDDGDAWVKQTCARVLRLLRRAPATTRELRAQLPVLEERLPRPENRKGAPTPVASRVLTVLAASGAVVRGANDGAWSVSRPLWTPVEDWLDDPEPPLSEADGYAELVRRWLWAFGPGSEADLVWWLGATKTAVRRALSDTSAVAVRLEDSSPAWLHPDDTDQIRTSTAWAALLPALDPTTMGWRERGFYVDEATASSVFDSAGNGRPTAWWDGRIVGSWHQDAGGTVVVRPTEALDRRASKALDHEAERLTAWLDGHLIRTAFQSPQE